LEIQTKSDFEVIKSKVDDCYIGFYKPCHGLTFRADTKEKALDGIREVAKKKEEDRPRLEAFARMQEEGQKDIPRLLAQLKEIDEKYERKRNMPDKHIYKISWSELDNQYVGTCEEYPSLSWLATTQEDTLRGIKNLVKEVDKDIAQNE
jgi:predicted RNase H-like HicB family nuclease